jgi:hypothetical protein
MSACQNASPWTQEREILMRRKRFQKGSVRPRKHGRQKVWVAQWWEQGRKKSKVLGRCGSMPKSEAEARFLTERNTPLSRDNLWNRHMRPKLETVGLEWPHSRFCAGQTPACPGKPRSTTRSRPISGAVVWASVWRSIRSVILSRRVKH